MTVVASFVVSHKPKVKERPRLGRRGRVYTPQATHDYEALVAASYDGPLIEVPVATEMSFFKDYTEVRIRALDLAPSKLRGDIDNYTKAILDGLNGVAFADDRQVVRLLAEKGY